MSFKLVICVAFAALVISEAKSYQQVHLKHQKKSTEESGSDEDEAFHHAQVRMYDETIEHVRNYINSEDSKIFTDCNVDLHAHFATINRPVTLPEVNGALDGMSTFVNKTKKKFDGHHATSTQLETTISSLVDPNHSSGLNMDAIDKYWKLGENVSAEIDGMKEDAICAYLALLPVTLRMGFLGVDHSVHCRSMLDQLMDYARTHNKDRHSEVCNIITILEPFRGNLHDDVRCLYGDVESLLNLLNGLKMQGSSSHSDVMANVERLLNKLERTFEDLMTFKKSLHTIGDLLGEYISNPAQCQATTQAPVKKEMLDEKTLDELRALLKLFHKQKK